MNNTRKKTLAIVLRRTDFGEADRIVNLLTPGGKVSAMARGVRKPKSKLAGGIEFFALNEVVLIEDEINLESDKNGKPLQADLTYSFDFYDKVFVEDSEGDFNANHIKFLRLMLSSQPQIISKVKGNEKILEDLKEVFFMLNKK